MQIVAEEIFLLAAGVGCGTLIARFALTQLFRVTGMGRRSAAADRPGANSNPGG